MNSDIILAIITSTLRLSVPVMLAAVGCTFSTRAGVTAFGCEGMMAAGAIFAVMGSDFTGSKWIGVLLGVLAGMLISSLHAVLHIKHRVNATLSGMSVNLLGTAVGSLALKLVWKVSGMSPEVAAFSKIAASPSMSWVARIPVIGHVLGEQSIFFLITIVVVIVSWVFLYKTTFGLRMRMVGENPVAANTVGINTVRYKYFGVLVCGLLAGLAGAFLSLAGMNRYIIGMTAGRGYVAMVINNLGGSNPIGAAFSALFFGLFDCMQFVFQGVRTPSQILMMLPYVFTLIICVGNTNRAKGPAGVGQHFDS